MHGTINKKRGIYWHI